MAQEYDTFMKSGRKWFCHVDDDNYVNVVALRRLLSQHAHTHNVYLGRPSLERPIEATQRLGATHTVRLVPWRLARVECVCEVSCV
ncbi:Beta-1,3-N-acetylglucosaminyltransferase lunatic fringe [Liparis tanakae]|uniref:Beta-1,3-N-acetylglucosaminyltransferase lunatic fringe n=1 Tax=Liparis tanakae TaxID=230148 RepID=A0A4Z2E9L7_9TELE|nr:Beta-1,3-N-acetylglucosaminyltransferase lunatic fringe [Liparis tanakae]